MTKTLTQLIRERDYLRDRLSGFDPDKRHDYPSWPERDKIEFDIEREQTRIALNDAELAYSNAVHNTARNAATARCLPAAASESNADGVEHE